MKALKKIFIIGSLVNMFIFPLNAKAYYNNQVTKYYVPVVEVQSFRVPDYVYCCVNPADKSTCYYKRSSSIPEKSVIRSMGYRMDNNGKKTKTYEKSEVIIKPLYLKTNGKPMTESEISRIKQLLNSVDQNQSKEEKVKIQKDFENAQKDVM